MKNKLESLGHTTDQVKEITSYTEARNLQMTQVGKTEWRAKRKMEDFLRTI